MKETAQTDPKAAGGVRKGEFGKFQQTGKRMLLVLFLVMLLSCMFGGIWPAVWFTQYNGTWATSPLGWTLVILLDVLIFGLGYLATLLLWRIIIPPPKEGFYRFRKDGRPTREIVIFMLNIQLTRLRYGTPWSSSLIHTLSHLPVINGIYRRLFCPNLHMITMGDSNVMVDPYLMHIHPTVQLASGGRFGCHLFDQRGLYIKRLVIEEHALIGPEVLLGPGVHIGHHSIVEGFSAVAPGTYIPPFEQWGGRPACKVQDIKRPTGERSIKAASASG